MRILQRNPLPRLGLVAHLILAFVAVAALAIAANLIAEHGTLIVHTREVVTVAQPPPVSVQLPVRQSPQQELKVVEPPASQGVVETEMLISTVDRFGAVALNRVAELSASWSEQLKSAGDDLQKAARTYVDMTAATAGNDRRSSRRLLDRVTTHQVRGTELVRTADSREKQFRAVWTQFEEVDVRTKTTLDRAWKIFGRIVTRQSVVDLGRRLDEIRRNLGTLATPQSYQATDLAALAGSEAAFETALEQATAALTRSQGTEWVARLRQDFTSLVKARETLVATDTALREATREFPADSAELKASIRNLEAKRRATVKAQAAHKAADRISLATTPSQAKTATTLAAANAARANVLPATNTTSGGPAIEAAPAAQAGTLPQFTASREVDSHLQHLLKWVSVLALLILATVCISISMRIVSPVRRLVQATRKVASGQASVRVASGGIRELDELASSFNAMAERIEAAQQLTHDHQLQLEAKVQERTRQLQHLAEHDPLTELPNRRQLFSELEVALQEAGVHGHQVGVLVLDLDNFKNINDSMGHDFGDQLLQAIAKRLAEIVAPLGFSARLGGDEFTVVIEKGRRHEDIAEAGRSILRAFQKPLPVAGRELSMSLSIGAACFPAHAKTADALLRAADAALFRAKALGRNQVSVFSPDLLDAAASRFRTEQGLRLAIERGELELAFQPELEALSLEVRLVEALLRWRLPDGRLASTADFLAVAEESGLINDISDWVLTTAVQAAAHWHHGMWRNARVAINVSPRQLLDTRFVDRVAGLLQEHRLPASCIEIELTENVLQTGAATIESLRRLRALGVGIALDDFGAGFSSLASLEQLPLTRVKLDRSLVASIDTSGRALAIARAIVGLCESLELDITAEGIERPEQLALLLGFRNMYLQGYLLSRPIPARDVTDAMARMPSHMQNLLLTLPGAGPESGVIEISAPAEDEIARSA